MRILSRLPENIFTEVDILLESNHLGKINVEANKKTFSFGISLTNCGLPR